MPLKKKFRSTLILNTNLSFQNRNFQVSHQESEIISHIKKNWIIKKKIRFNDGLALNKFSKSKKGANFKSNQKCLMAQFLMSGK